MMKQYIRFDWAMKRLLRNKTNYGVLEGLLTTMLGEQVKIHRLLKCEHHQEDKYNRVDMLAENSKGDLILIEVQNNNEYTYFQRMLFDVSKLVTKYMHRGEGYEKVRKIYSISIIYFSLGHGKDYVCHGTTEFRGIHDGGIWELSPFQHQTFNVDTVSQLFSEYYYILKVNDFNKVDQTPLEEWIYYLNTGNIPEKVTASGWAQVKELLNIDRVNKSEQEAYYRHLDNIVILRSNIYTERAEGRFEGRAEGRAEGLEEGRAEGRLDALREMAKKMKAKGMDIQTISEVTGLDVGELNLI